jgi:hemoglobin-like flavoprotein
MFPKNRNEQYTKLIDMITMVVSRLDNLEELTEDIAAKAGRHVGYGVKPQHNKLVGTALL